MKQPFLSDDQLTLLSEHGLRRDQNRITTIVLGHGGQTRDRQQLLVPDKGFMKPNGVVECRLCGNSRLNKMFRLGPYREWYDGHTVREKHWNQTQGDFSEPPGLKLRCFYWAYLELLQEARKAYETGDDPSTTSLGLNGRTALVRLRRRDILYVNGEPDTEDAEKDASIDIYSRQLRVLDLVDQLPLVPSREALVGILDAPAAWHSRWHKLVDAIQPNSWRDFPARMVATLQAVRADT